MSRKPRKGYFVRGQFIAEGSEEDLQLKAELKGVDVSRGDLKRVSDELQALGAELLSLRGDLFKKLELPERLVEALQEAKRITNFEGKRRQMQFVGKLMRKLDENEVESIRQALDIQRNGSAEEKVALHRAEQWRDRLLADDDALTEWIAEFPNNDVQQVRTLIRQARKDDATTKADISQGKAPRKGKAYRELFQLIQLSLKAKNQQQEDAVYFDPDAHED